MKDLKQLKEEWRELVMGLKEPKTDKEALEYLESVEVFWLSKITEIEEASLTEGRRKELEILRLHLDKQVMERVVYTASLYEYINQALSTLPQ